MTLSAEAEMEPGQMDSIRLVLCVLVPTCYSTSVPFRFSVHSVCVCMCVCVGLIVSLFLAVVTVAQSF